MASGRPCRPQSRWDQWMRRRLSKTGPSVPDALPRPRRRRADAAPDPERSRWRFVAAVYAYSALLALITAALWLIGPLHGLAPVRLLIPQGAMFAVVSVLWVVADRVPVQLPFRGDTYDFVLEEVPLLFGLVFLAPNLLVLSTVCAVAFIFTVLRRQALMKMAFNVASAAFATALAATGLPRAPGPPQPGQPPRLGRGGGGPRHQPGHHDPHAPGRHHAQRPDGRSSGPGSSWWRSTRCSLAASLCLAFAFLDAAWHNPWTTLPLVVVAVLIIVAFRGYARLRSASCPCSTSTTSARP